MKKKTRGGGKIHPSSLDRDEGGCSITSRPQHDPLTPKPIVIKQFHPKEGAWKGTEKVLSQQLLKQLAELALVINVFLLLPVLFIEYTLNPWYFERGHINTFSLEQRLIAPCQIEQGLIIFFITTGPAELIHRRRNRYSPPLCFLPFSTWVCHVTFLPSHQSHALTARVVSIITTPRNYA
jgi:hypothetical protein